jgi:hypothetical protein
VTQWDPEWGPALPPSCARGPRVPASVGQQDTCLARVPAGDTVTLEYIAVLEDVEDPRGQPGRRDHVTQHTSFLWLL